MRQPFTPSPRWQTFFKTFALLALIISASLSTQAQCNIRYGWTYTNLGGDSINFNAEDTNSAAHHYWVFGDGHASTVNSTNVNHVYSQPGTYRVCFYVYVPSTSCSDSFCQTIVVNSPVSCPVSASWFSYGLGGDSMRFYASDTTSAAHHIWSWGDGNSTSGTTLTNHTYTAPATYHVCLYVYIPGTTCSDSMCQDVTVAFPPCTINADWTSYSLGGDSMRFYCPDTTTAAHHIYAWGDGSYTSGLTVTNHRYAAPGTYHVCLYVYLPGTPCSDSLCQNVTILGTSTACNIRYGWNYSSTGGDSVTFSAEDTVSSAHHFWNFGDGTSSTTSTMHTSHVYAQSGTYHVCFYVYIPGTTCSDSFCQTITVVASNPCHVSAAWSSYSLGGDSVRFYSTDTNSAARHNWAWGDGSYTAGATVVNHHYAQPGSYHVCYYVYIPGTNCSDSVCETVVVGSSTGSTCHITASWTSYSIGGDSIRFYAADTNSSAHHIWTFGDGTYASATTAVTHRYAGPGTYHVCFYTYIPNTNCADSSCSTVTITAVNPPCSLTAVWHSYALGGDSVYFHTIDTTTAAHHIWTWGDGTYTSGTLSTTHVYTTAGTYHVCLYVYIPGTGCSDSLCDNVTVGGSPCHITALWAAYSTGGDSVRFYAADTNSAAHHVWVWGDGSYTSGALYTTHHYADTGTYHVCLYVYLPGTNCTDSSCADVSLSATGHFQLSAEFSLQPLGGDTFGFTAQDTSSEAYGIWSFGDGTIAFNTANPTHIYASSGVYTVCFYTFIPGTDIADTVCETIDVVLGINTINNQNVRIIAQPNPFNQSVLIRAEGLTGAFDLKVYDLVGKLIRSEKAINGSHNLNRDGISSGMYLFEVSQNGRVISTGKLVAQ